MTVGDTSYLCLRRDAIDSEILGVAVVLVF